jgi:hypothetical protein
METDDDIFIIHQRTVNILAKQVLSESVILQQQQTLIEPILSSKPPHGYTEADWELLRKTYQLSPSEGKEEKKLKHLTYKYCKEIIKQCEELEEKKGLGLLLQMYKDISQTILEEYKACLQQTIHTDFMSAVKRVDISPEQKHIRDKLISLIDHLFGVEVVNKVVVRKKCSSALTHEIDDSSVADFGCEDGDEEWNGMVYNDINRINFNQKFKYDKRQHFKDTINQYQGLQHKNIPDKVLSDIMDMIDKHGLIDYTSSDPTQRFAKLTKEHVKMFLAETKNALYYEDIQLIYSRITGFPCPNIQKYEKYLYQDFEQLVEVFLNLPKDVVKRDNFLNTHYVLRQLLRRRGIEISEYDLNFLKTPSRRRDHDDIYQMCCEKLGWDFTHLLI